MTRLDSFKLTISEIREAVEGNLIKGCGANTVTGISIDSRTVQSGDLFICIEGERFNGHDYIDEAIRKKTAAILCLSGKETETLSQEKNIAVIVVQDTTSALGDLAAYYRRQFSFPVVGITGSNGKTTSKEIASSVLSRTHKVLKNEGNLNNLIGVPLTLFNLRSTHEAAVIEMGMNKAGEIKRLCAIAGPTIGVVTNVGPSHQGNFSSLDGIKREKEELVSSLPDDGVAILNYDDELVRDMGSNARCKVVSYGMSPQLDLFADDISADESGKYDFTLVTDRERTDIDLAVSGYHSIYNALSAAGVGAAFNMELPKIKKGIESFCGMPMRMEITKREGITIINDAYNANPVSVDAAIHTLEDISCRGKRIFVFGDMAELGEESFAAHKRVGEAVVDAGIDIFITAGDHARDAFCAALQKGMNNECLVVCKDTKEAYKALSSVAVSGDCVLLKGSRKMKLEKILELWTYDA